MLFRINEQRTWPKFSHGVLPNNPNDGPGRLIECHGFPAMEITGSLIRSAMHWDGLDWARIELTPKGTSRGKSYVARSTAALESCSSM